MAQRPSTSGALPAAPYFLTELLRGNSDSFEAKFSEILAKHNDPGSRTPSREGTFYLPTASFLAGAGLTRDMVTGTSTLGGNLIGESVQRVAAAARPPLLLERIGALRVEVTKTGDVTLPVWSEDVVGAWVSEGASAPSLPATIRSVNCSGRMACARLGFSRRLLIQGVGVEGAVLAEVERAVAGTIEPAFIGGNGSQNAPLGIIHTPGTLSQSFAGSSPVFAELASMLEQYALEDGELSRACWLMHPSTVADLMQTQITASDAQMLAVVSGQSRTPLVCGLPVYISRHVPSGKVILLDPTEIRTVFWGSPQLVVDRFSGSKAITGAVELDLFNLCDIAVLHPHHVVIGAN